MEEKEYRHKQDLIIAKVIELLYSNPKQFSARWFNGRSLDCSVMSRDQNIMIMIERGEIVRPIKADMSQLQKDRVKELIAPIVKRDRDYITNKAINDLKL